MKYVAYCRKSTEAEDRQALSIGSQETELRKIADRDGFEITKLFTEAKSAKASGRPVFGEVLQYIQKHGDCVLLVWKPDRIARNMVDGGMIIELMDKGFIKEIRTPEKSFHNTSDDKFMMALDFGIAKKYVDDLSLNVKRGNRAKLEHGGWPSYAPIGYVNDRLTKTLYLDEKIAPYIPRMFERYAKGDVSLLELSNIMYADGLRTRNGKKVMRSFIHRMLKDPFYMGVMFHGGKLYQGNHTPLISKELYDAANEIMDGHRHGRKQKQFFHLRGFLVCAQCECAITASKHKGHDYYFCTNGKGICDQKKNYIRAEILDGMIAKTLTKLQIDQELVEMAYEAAKVRSATDNSYTDASLQILQNRLKQIEIAQSKLADSFGAEITPETVYTPKMKALTSEATMIMAEIKKMQAEGRKRVSTLEPTQNAFLKGISAQNDYLNGDPEAKRKMLSELLWNFSIKDKIVQDFRFKPVYAAIAKDPKPTNFAMMCAGEDSNLHAFRHTHLKRAWLPLQHPRIILSILIHSPSMRS